MPVRANSSSVLEHQLLLQLGARLKRLRIERGLSTVAMSQRAGISRTSLNAVEAGSPTVAMGMYLRVMATLGLAGNLALLASDSVVPMTVKVSSTEHELQDLQSLVLHRAAVQCIKQNPALIQQALTTLDRWRSTGARHTCELWNQWEEILRRKAWKTALGHTDRAKQLRQASPLPTLLPADLRNSILAGVRELERGVSVNSEHNLSC